MTVVVFDQPGEDSIKIEIDGAWNDDMSRIYDESTRQGPLGQVREISADLLREGMDLVGSCAKSAHDVLAQIPKPRRPDEFELQIAVKLDASIGAVLAKSTAGAQLQVVLRWKGESVD